MGVLSRIQGLSEVVHAIPKPCMPISLDWPCQRQLIQSQRAGNETEGQPIPRWPILSNSETSTE